MKKRFLSAFLALALIVSLCPMAFAASGQIKASLSSAQVKQGEKVSIQFKLDENPGFVSTNIQVNWPKDDLTLMAVSGTDTITGWMGEPIPSDGKTDGKYVLSWQNNTIHSNITTTGVLCTLEFATLSSGSVGEKEITLSNSGPGQQFANVDMDTVDAVLTGGKITISSAITGNLLVDIAKPVVNQAPVTTLTDTRYSGSITWTPDVTDGKFAANTEYTANVTLTATDGYQFASDVNPTIEGATISNVSADGTKLTFKAKFDATGSLPAASVTDAPKANTDLKYNGGEQDLLSFKGNASGGDMQYSLNGTDWTDTDPMGKDAGDYTVYYKAKGDSTHSDSAVASISVTIDPKDISGVTSVSIVDQPYTGSAITPDPEVKDGATKLVKDTDYTVSSSSKYVGTATLTITGKGNYTGTKDANFAITAVNQNPTFTTPKDLVKGGHTLDLRTLVQGAKGDMTFTISGGTSTYATLEDGHTLTSTVYSGTVNINVRIAAGDENNDGNNEYNAFNKDNAITVNVVDKTTNTSTMKVSQDNIIYGETVSPSVTNKPDGTGTVSYTYEGREGTSYNSTTAPTNVGKYKVTATCESSTTIYTAVADFKIQPKSISGMTVTLDKTSLEYTGSAQTVTVTSVGSLTTADYNVTGKTSGTNVGSYTVTVTGKGNYTDTATATWKITQATPTYTAPTGLTAKYGQTLADVNIAATTGWSWMDSTQSVGNASTTPKTFKATFTPTDANYKTVENIEVSVAVDKADARTLEDITVNQKYTVTTGEKAIGAVMPDDAGTLTYAKGTTESTTGSVTIDSWNVDTTTGKVTYTLSGGKANDTVTLPVTITSTNYADTTVNVKIKLIKGSSGGYYYAPTVPDMPMLYRGCTGDAVKTLQDKLNALGYNSGNVDGIFGAKTYAAVTAFQKANSLGVDGIVGKLTWGKLYGVSPAMPVETTTVVGRPMVSYGSRGDAVRKLQELLNALGYDCGSVDGIFGSKTKAAVLAFQKANGLGVDGIVGPLTWAKLG